MLRHRRQALTRQWGNACCPLSSPLQWWSSSLPPAQHEHSFDVMTENFDVRCKLLHDMGTGGSPLPESSGCRCLARSGEAEAEPALCPYHSGSQPSPHAHLFAFAGTNGKWGVIQKGVMVDGNLDLHRGLSGPTLYTDIDVGVGTDALHSGGPTRSGPNAAAGTTWWNIRRCKLHACFFWANRTVQPGSCSPVFPCPLEWLTCLLRLPRHAVARWL